METSIPKITVEIVQLLSPKQAWHYNIVPFEIENGTLSVFCVAEGLSDTEKKELKLITGKKIRLQKVGTDQLKALLGRYYRLDSSKGKANFSFSPNSSQPVQMNSLIDEAVSIKASDIHFEPFEDYARVRFRVDGVLYEKYKLRKEDYPSLVNKLKISANLDISEKRLPQDGRILLPIDNQKVDIRVSSLPTLFGEKVVLRLLTNNADDLDIRSIGFNEKDISNYLEGIKKPNGIVLISGPTGSGKTTTLYATLKYLNEASRNIITIEDPIEYTLEGVNQVQLKEAIGLDYSKAIRTFLRQDPDVIMVGEIRDVSTATMAIRASLTGHLVFSTIHTNSAWGIVSRLMDMGVPPFLIADTLNAAVAQRLVRRLCKECKFSTSLTKEDLPKGSGLINRLSFHYKSSGCQHCHYSGYKGRLPVFEVIPIDDELSYAIKTGATKDPNDELQKKGINTLKSNAIELLERGETSLEEVYPLIM